MLLPGTAQRLLVTLLVLLLVACTLASCVSGVKSGRSRAFIGYSEERVQSCEDSQGHQVCEAYKRANLCHTGALLAACLLCTQEQYASTPGSEKHFEAQLQAAGRMLPCALESFRHSTFLRVLLPLFICRLYSYAVQATCGPRAKGRAVSAADFARGGIGSDELRAAAQRPRLAGAGAAALDSAAPARPQCWRASARGAPPRVRRRGRQGAPAPLLAFPAWRSCQRTCRRLAPRACRVLQSMQRLATKGLPVPLLTARPLVAAVRGQASVRAGRRLQFAHGVPTGV